MEIKEIKYPLPPFTEETARQKIQVAEDAWNSKDPDRVSKAYTANTEWRNRSEFINGRDAVKSFLEKKWEKERGRRIIIIIMQMLFQPLLLSTLSL